VELMQIAQEFDRKEREQMMQAGVDSPDFLKYMAVRIMWIHNIVT